jgi:hypothetical protein
MAPSSTKEAVNHPAHYNSHPSGIEAIDLIEDLPFNIGNAIKYIYRRAHKDSVIEDLRKALWYTTREIERRTQRSFQVQEPSPAVRNLAPLFGRVFVCEQGNRRIEEALRDLYNAALSPLDCAPLHSAARFIAHEIDVQTLAVREERFAAGASSPVQEAPVPDSEVVALASLIKAERFHCKVCSKAGSVSRTPNGPFSITCTTCGANVSAEERGLAFERWTTLLSKQNPKSVGERVAAAQLRDDTPTPRDSH